MAGWGWDCRPDTGGGRRKVTATFKATLAGSGEGPYLRTGDLGFIHRGRAVSDRPAQGSDHRAGTELLSP